MRCFINTNESTPTSETTVLQTRVKRTWLATAKNIVLRLALFTFSVIIFILALILMKEGARPLAPLIRDRFSVNSPTSAIGFGWLSASLALSGSPIAATALTFLDAGVINPTETFAMISGSRLGAAFVVLLIGFVYMIRGKTREISLGVGLLSLLVTQTIYIAVLPLGFLLISNGWLNSWRIDTNHSINSPFELIFNPLVGVMKQTMPTWMLFPIGFGLMIASMSLFDRAIPNLHLEETKVGHVNRLLYRPIVGFLLGAGMTTLTMSVSVSLSLLVPLSIRGYIRRENVIPYILGANITTFVDTLIAAALLANPAAVSVVIVQIISVTIVSLVILSLSFNLYERTLERLVSFISSSEIRLAIYIFIIFAVPFTLLLFT
jgi:sodium-dependent phosphate cotransporter